MYSNTWSFKEWDHSLPSPSSSAPSALRQFSLAEITKATNNFDQALLLRRGWLNEVYKGTYVDYDGREKTVAIKYFHLDSSVMNISPTWFQQKMEVCAQFRHQHVVPVIGYCQQPPGTYIVVYEYMPNGSLAKHLVRKMTPTSFTLSWEQCLQICIDAARGLEYLHTYIRYSNGDPFIHGDVTTINILLDGNGVAKIADLYNEPLTRQHEPAFCLDPQYHSNGNINQCSDVYAFGVLLVKVLFRRSSFDGENRNVGVWFKQCIHNGSIYGSIHSDIKAQISPNCLKAFVNIASECLNNEPQKRPTFTQVAERLKLLMASSTQRLCHRFSLNEIKDATNNFVSILGEGGEGKVYKGVTRTNATVAVKRLKPEYSAEFQKEIKMLSDLNHPNLVSLVGYCQESDQNILIYEFMSNGNLAQSLYGAQSGSMSWKQRLNICIGAARGLRHLHTGTNNSRKGIIHRDVKPVNILLDENFNAKISDFGLSKMGQHQDHAKSEIATMIKGTTGYYAPEYQRFGQITRKIDVYAFGVVLTEVLCRKKPWDREESFYPTEDEKYHLWATENIDSDLKGTISPTCLEIFTSLLESCLHLNPNKRPSMHDVVSMLEYAQKWQGTWETQKSGGGFHLPGSEDRIVLYYSSISQHVARTIRLRLLLRTFGLQIDERDIKRDIYGYEFKNIFTTVDDILMPLVFVRGKYVGDVNEMERLHEMGELTKLLQVPRPRFICNSCGEAKACAAGCTRTELFIHCKTCDALSVVSKQYQGKMRSCIICDGNQSIYGTNTVQRPQRVVEYLAKGIDILSNLFQ